MRTCFQQQQIEEADFFPETDGGGAIYQLDSVAHKVHEILELLDLGLEHFECLFINGALVGIILGFHLRL